MRYLLFVCLLYVNIHPASAQMVGDWSRLRTYAHAIGVDSLCAQPDSACVTRYFTQIIYGRTPRRMSYQGVAECLDTIRINQLTRQFLAGPRSAGADWCPLLDSLESALSATNGLLYALSGR